METGNTANMTHLVVHELCLQGNDAWSKQPGSLLFIFPSSGKGQYRNTISSLLVTKGDVLFLDAAAQGSLVSYHGRPFACKAFSVALEQLLALSDPSGLRSLHCNNDGLPRIYPRKTPVAESGRRLLSRAKPSPGLDSRAQLLRTATCILEAPLPANDGPSSSDLPQRQSAAGQALATLSDDEILSSSVSGLSRKLGFCRRHLNRVFKARYGLTHAAMKRELMLLKAASMLTRTSFKVVQVAEDCGFRHPGRFHVWFKNRFGVSPAEWRRISAADSSPGALRTNAEFSAICSVPPGQPKGGARVLHFSASSPSDAETEKPVLGDPSVPQGDWSGMALENLPAPASELPPKGQSVG